MIGRVGRWLTVALLFALTVPDARAQALAPSRLAARALSGAAFTGLPHRGDSVARHHSRVGALDRLPAWSAPLASLVVPGAGQARLGKDRFVAYLAAEVFLLLRYSKDHSEFSQNAQEFRDLARDVARRNFVPAPPDTIFQYYEKLEKYLESGSFTMVPNGPTVPEQDPSTYNGSLWQLARNQYGVPTDPGEVGSARYLAAVALYESRAVRQPYRWSWRNAQLEQDLFRRTIQRSNAASRRATLDLSALIANHLLSAVDAFAVFRLRQLDDGRLGLTTSVRVP